MSSKGQVVIPQQLRETLRLQEGDAFTIVAEQGIILLRKIPSVERHQQTPVRQKEIGMQRNYIQ